MTDWLRDILSRVGALGGDHDRVGSLLGALAALATGGVAWRVVIPLFFVGARRTTMPPGSPQAVAVRGTGRVLVVGERTMDAFQNRFAESILGQVATTGRMIFTGHLRGFFPHVV